MQLKKCSGRTSPWRTQLKKCSGRTAPWRCQNNGRSPWQGNCSAQQLRTLHGSWNRSPQQTARPNRSLGADNRSARPIAGGQLLGATNDSGRPGKVSPARPIARHGLRSARPIARVLCPANRSARLTARPGQPPGPANRSARLTARPGQLLGCCVVVVSLVVSLVVYC